MPKVTKKRNEAEDPLQDAAPLAIEAGVEGEEALTAVKPKFPPLSAYEQDGKRIEFRRIPVPQHRMTPLKNNWLALYKPVTENMKLDMRMNLKTKKVSPAWWWWGWCRRPAAASLPRPLPPHLCRRRPASARIRLLTRPLPRPLPPPRWR